MGSKDKGLQDDLQSLRDELGDMAGRLTTLLGEAGEDVADDMKERIQKISDDIDDALSQAGSKGRELVRQSGLDGVGESVGSSIREHPFATLAIAVGVGALVGSQLRR